MATISTALRHFKEPTKEQLTHIFFSIPPAVTGSDNGNDSEAQEALEAMEINAVLSLGEAVEDSYVSLDVDVESRRSINLMARQESCTLCLHSWLSPRWTESPCDTRFRCPPFGG
jgi:hypothetical protein